MADVKDSGKYVKGLPVRDVVVILVSVMMLFGVNTSLNAMEVRINNLDRQVATLEEVHDEIESLQREVNDIALVRNELIEAIERATRHRHGHSR